MYNEYLPLEGGYTRVRECACVAGALGEACALGKTREEALDAVRAGEHQPIVSFQTRKGGIQSVVRIGRAYLDGRHFEDFGTEGGKLV